MTQSHETNIQNEVNQYNRPPDLVERTPFVNFETSQLSGAYSLELWHASPAQRERLVATEVTVSQLAQPINTAHLVYNHAEHFANTLYPSAFQGYFEYLDMQGSYDYQFEGGSEATVEYPLIDVFTAKSAELDGPDETATQVRFAFTESGDIGKEEYLTALSQGIVLASKNHALRSHDIFFHMPAWVALPPKLRQAIFDEAGSLLQEYLSVKDVFDQTNSYHADVKRRTSYFMKVIDNNVNNLLLAELANDTNRFADAPSFDYSDAGNRLHNIKNITRQPDLDAGVLRHEMLNRIASSSQFAVAA